MEDIELTNDEAVATKHMMCWVEKFIYKENKEHTDATVEIVCSHAEDCERRFGMVTKNAAIHMVRNLAGLFTDVMTIDSICVTVDGDCVNDIVTINSEIHLAE